jgi:Na+/H+ antiporter NhaC
MRKKLRKFKHEFRKQSAVAIIAAFGFLIALSWRDFISEVVNRIVEVAQIEGSTYLLKLIAALIVTVVSIVGIMVASKMNVEEEEKD